jgi:hypothetical protein
MGNKLMMVNVVFEYFIQYFKKGKMEPTIHTPRITPK